jgi:hypothetical protein
MMFSKSFHSGLGYVCLKIVSFRIFTLHDTNEISYKSLYDIICDIIFYFLGGGR